MLYIVLDYPPSSSKGGIEKVVREIVRGLTKQQKKNTRIICNGIDENIKIFDDVVVINLQTKRYKIVDFLFFYSHIVFSYKLYVFLKKNAKSGDVVNVHEGDGISTIFSLCRWRIKKQIKVVIVNHALVLMRRISFIKELPNKYILLKIVFCVLLPYYYLIERSYLTNADYIVTITHKTKKFIETYYTKKFNSVIIRNGMDCQKRAVCSGNEPKTAIIVGSVTYPKGLDVAIEAVIKFNANNKNKINLNIIGFWDFEKYYKNKKIPNFIKYVGSVEYNRMNEQYKKADFLLFPSRSEEFASLVVLEALQNGLPIVVSKECNVNEMDGWEKWGYQVNTWKVDDWVESLGKITNIDNFKQKQQNINKQDFSEYDWKNISAQYEKLFNDLEL